MGTELYCIECVERASGQPVRQLSVAEFKRLSPQYIIRETPCPRCGSTNAGKLFGIEAAYIKGYGYADKAGVKRDMDMHLMARGQDPYKAHRQPGEGDEVVRRLQKSREHDKRSKTFYL